MLQTIQTIYERKEKSEELGDCALDRTVLHNQRCRAEKNIEDYIGDEELLGTVFLFHFAGTDTSQTIVKSALLHGE